MVVTTPVTRSRTARLLTMAGVGAAAVFAVIGAPSVGTDSADRVAVCSGDEVSGVEVDNCVPNPNPNNTTDVPGDYPLLVPELEFGVGI
ncbi:MAG: hypothetical protein QOE41_3781 [Mycobacterium sp.]|jgi:hypothetical protein|nr:hypothetical protein [Mycobacterium sp.]MDT5134470.1 hypothetical protein [Mycobacterium sp.]